MYSFFSNHSWWCVHFFQIQGNFHYNFRSFKTEILHIYSLIGQIQIKQLFPEVEMSIEYILLSREFITPFTLISHFFN